MAVTPETAAELVYQIFDLQRSVRCIFLANVRGQETGLALQGVLRFIGEGKPAPPGWPIGWASAPLSLAGTSRTSRSWG